eukprot:Polyplicarium_translucidae@DN4759_c0_g1_i1.p1
MSATVLSTGPPPYGLKNRDGWLPRSQADFRGGGAFPEVHVAQFPLDMGRSASDASKTVAIQVGEDGKVHYDAILKQGSTQALQTLPGDQVALWTRPAQLVRPTAEEDEETAEKTRNALKAALAVKQTPALAASVAKTEPEYIRYTPNQQAPGHNANCAQRIIRISDKKIDPMEPPKFQHKRVPRAPPSPPPPILRSPPRKLTAKEEMDWKIPPCVSNWKNRNGMTIPLDKRLQADGRRLQDVAANDKFGSVSEALHVAERVAREEIRIRNDMIKQKKRKEEELREEKLRDIASRARARPVAMAPMADQATRSPGPAPRAEAREADAAPPQDFTAGRRSPPLRAQRERPLSRSRSPRRGRDSRRDPKEEEERRGGGTHRAATRTKTFPPTTTARNGDRRMTTAGGGAPRRATARGGAPLMTTARGGAPLMTTARGGAPLMTTARGGAPLMTTARGGAP